MIGESISSTSIDKLKEISQYWFSIYPLLYKELSENKRKSFSFYNENMSYMFSELKTSTTIKEANNKFFFYTKKIFSIYNETDKDLFTEENLLELFYTFFSWDKVTRNIFVPLRAGYLKNSYNSDDIKDIFWRHDGWWNCYYGPLIDEEAKKELEKFEPKTLHDKIKKTLTLAYRYTENNQIKEAVKEIKKNNKFLKLRFFLSILKNKDKDISEIPQFMKYNLLGKMLYSFLCYYLFYIRYDLNLNMLLYRTSKNRRKKLKIINKIIKRNRFTKLFFRDVISRLYHPLVVYRRMYMRPQHILKLIEVRIDKYVLKPNKKILEEIKFLFKEVMVYIDSGYYKKKDSINIIHFIISEIYFTLFYFLKKVYPEKVEEWTILD